MWMEGETEHDYVMLDGKLQDILDGSLKNFERDLLGIDGK